MARSLHAWAQDVWSFKLAGTHKGVQKAKKEPGPMAAQCGHALVIEGSAA